MHKRVHITATIVSGRKQGAFFTQLDWVQDQCRRELGFAPYPGTLNLQVAPESLPVLEALLKAPGRVLVPPDPAFCSGRVFAVEIEALPAAIVFPATAVRSHAKDIIEVLAPVKLRDVLRLKDGDSVTLAVEPSYLTLPARGGNKFTQTN
jgi:CTP-dependent riboflavin kinase